jgi:hypothetical protein
MVEADERVGDDEAALREPGAVFGERDRRLEHGHVVVAEVADDGPPGCHLPLGLVEGHQARAGTDEAVLPEPPLLD